MDESIPIIKISSSPILSVDGQRKTPILIQEDRDRELSIQLKNETGNYTGSVVSIGQRIMYNDRRRKGQMSTIIELFSTSDS